MKRSIIAYRYLLFVIALLFIGVGVAFITGSLLGTTPTSCIPYVMSLNMEITMGQCVLLFNAILIMIQLAILPKKDIIENKVSLLMQIPSSLILAAVIDAVMTLLAIFTLGVYISKFIILIMGCVVLSLGICIEIISDTTMVSGEYTVKIIADRYNKRFSDVKILFDVVLVIIAIISSLLFSQTVNGVGEGTVIAALITGPLVKVFMARTQIVCNRVM